MEYKGVFHNLHPLWQGFELNKKKIFKILGSQRHFISSILEDRIHLFEPVHEISNNVVCATSKASDQPAHKRSLIRALASRSNIL